MERSRCPKAGVGILVLIIHTRRRAQEKACKIHWFSLRFKHIKKFEEISKHPPSTGQGLQALSDNSPKKFNVFLA